MFPCVNLKDCALEISKCQAICGSVICMERTRGGWLIQRSTTGFLDDEIKMGCAGVLKQAQLGVQFANGKVSNR